MPRTSFGKARPINNPYAVYKDTRGGWEWRVLKTYKHSAAEKNDNYARWNVAVKSPFTHGTWEGPADTYIRDLINHGSVKLVTADDKWLAEYTYPSAS